MSRLAKGFAKMLSALQQLQEELPAYLLHNHSELAPGQPRDDESLTWIVFQVLESAARLQRSLRQARIQIGVDRPRSKGVQLGRPRNATVDEEAIIGQVGNGASISSTAEQHGIARSTIRAIVARGNGFVPGETVHQGAPIVTGNQNNNHNNDLKSTAADPIEGNGNGAVWTLSSDEKFDLIAACQIAVECQMKIVDRLEAHEECRTLPHRELAESVKQREELIGKFQRLLEKLRRADLSESSQGNECPEGKNSTLG